MNEHPPESKLINFIKGKHSEYYGKICELRAEIKKWLTYIPSTFPHYTLHTIEHSDTIVSQMSKLLFRDSKSSPIVSLSGIEAYILVAAAYLHDSGMVTSDKEKGEILSSEGWKKWTSGEGGGAFRWNEVQKLRSDAGASDAAKNFVADVQTRFLIAEYVRGQHHLRVANVIEVHSDKLGRIDFGNHMLRNAIAQVCVGHGLRLHEIDDNERFPDLCDIREEPVNLRFLAMLLRLGDLLDMTVDRACPLLLSAAEPLPPDSFSHWEQYKAITQRATSPTEIKVIADCQTQEVHRTLQDWCQWIVDEINHAKLVVPKFQRHSEWQIPEATIEADAPTIKIRPAAGANYVPSKWTLQFDQQAIFERLSESIYSDPLVFVRELIQNALDALRCRMYADLANEGKPLPDYPTRAEESFRNRYKVNLSISNREIKNPMSGEMETKQILVIEDNGLGMDTDVIKKYFLQVGRSYYTSDEFRRHYQFHPTSRFGIGFLSVFAVSDNITVETFKPTSTIQNNEPLKITLTGFRNYLLREKSDRKTPGTRIEIVLRNPIEENKLTELVYNWCRRVEFPIIVDDLGKESVITAEHAEDFTYEMPLVTEPNAKFMMRSFPVNRPGIEGELYIFAYVTEDGEFWNYQSWDVNSYAYHPLAAKPETGGELTCLHGITISQNSNYSLQPTSRIDYRNSKFIPILNRTGLVYDEPFQPSEIISRWREILTEHLETHSQAKSEDFWKYKQDLVDKFQFPDFWSSLGETIKIYHENSYKVLSLNDFLALNEFNLLSGVGNFYGDEQLEEFIDQTDEDSPILTGINDISGEHLEKIFRSSRVNKIRWVSDNSILIRYRKETKNDRYSFIDEARFIDLEKPELISIRTCIENRYNDRGCLFNSNNPVIKWAINIKEAELKGKYNLEERHFNQILLEIRHIAVHGGGSFLFENLQKSFSQWKAFPGLPEELYPPDIELTKEMFGYKDEALGQSEFETKDESKN